MAKLQGLIDAISARGYHNHRRRHHFSDLSTLIVDGLIQRCDAVARDLSEGAIVQYKDVRIPPRDGVHTNLLVARPSESAEIRPQDIRIAICHTSVVTAHRNKGSRHDDLDGFLRALLDYSPDAICIGTALIGMSEDVLNVPDSVKRHFKQPGRDFEKEVKPRLSIGDESLWEEFPDCISKNRPDSSAKTIELFRSLATRNPGTTHNRGFDYLLIVPAHIDNVNPPKLASREESGIDAQAEFDAMLDTICRAYEMRWSGPGG
jgi:hypothetical protein